MSRRFRIYMAKGGRESTRPSYGRPKLTLREGFPKKSSCSFLFCPLYTNYIYWVNFGMGREGETPAQIFWHKKVVQVVQIRGRGSEVNLDKIQKNSYFFIGRPSLTKSIVAPQHRNPIPNVATENSLQQVQPRIKTRYKDFSILLLRPSPAQ